MYEVTLTELPRLFVVARMTVFGQYGGRAQPFSDYFFLASFYEVKKKIVPTALKQFESPKKNRTKTSVVL